MPDFWDGALAGYGIAIPVGAIAILIIETGLRRGFRYSAAAAAGAAGADLIYASLAAAAGESLAAALAPHAVTLRALSAAVLLIIGARGLRQLFSQGGQPVPGGGAQPGGGMGAVFLRFLGLTLMNPMTVAYFGALILGRPSGSQPGPLAAAFFVAGAAAASLSWQMLLAVVGAAGRQRLSPRFQAAAVVAGNSLIMAFGLRIVFQLLNSPR